MTHAVITLRTNDGESLDYISVTEPLPEAWQWQGRTFRRVADTKHYVEQEGIENVGKDQGVVP